LAQGYFWPSTGPTELCLARVHGGHSQDTVVAGFLGVRAKGTSRPTSFKAAPRRPKLPRALAAPRAYPCLAPRAEAMCRQELQVRRRVSCLSSIRRSEALLDRGVITRSCGTSSRTPNVSSHGQMATKALSWPELSCWPPSPFFAESGCSSSALPVLRAPLIWPARSELSAGHVVPEASSSSVRADKVRSFCS
jgi:hypothetical protein